MTLAMNWRLLPEATPEFWADEFWEVYGDKDVTRDLLQTWAMAVEDATKVATSIRRRAYADSAKELTHVFCWVVSFVNKLKGDPSVPARFKNSEFTSISDMVWYKYPQTCPLCLNRTCSCPLLRHYPTKEQINTALEKARSGENRPQTLRQWQTMFSNIYEAAQGTMTVPEIGFHFFEEIGEVQHSIRDIATLTEEQVSEIPKVAELQYNMYMEIADTISWIFALLQKFSSEIERFRPFLGDGFEAPRLFLDELLYKEFYDPSTKRIRCPRCTNRPCSCTIRRYDREDELLDQLERLPSQDQIRQLVGLLGKPSLKMLSEGLLVDGVEACKKLDILAVVKVLNSWTATVEEKVAAGNRINRILSRRKRVVGADE